MTNSNLTGLKYLVVGAGLFGSVVAERIATQLKEKVLVIDQRKHTGGNAHAAIDAESGIETHTYGSHIFHTRLEHVWNYINRFTSFNNYRHRIFTMHKGQAFPMPIGLQTINQFYSRTLKPYEVEEFIRDQIPPGTSNHPQNLEEKAISQIGEPLYRALIEGYTKKQWGKSPSLLPADIINRLPVRHSYNSDYFSDPYQGIPSKGYQAMFDALLSHPNIELQLGVSYSDISSQIPVDCTVVYTGIPDALFDYRYGPLEWRSLRFEWESRDCRDYQGNSVINYADEDVAYTRIHEYKHYHPEWHQPFNTPRTIICREYPASFKQGDEAFYPVNDKTNVERYELYAQEAKKQRNLILGGRLGAYQYWDMDKTIDNALACFDRISAAQG